MATRAECGVRNWEFGIHSAFRIPHSAFTNERGALFGFAIITAVVSSIAAYAALFSATAGARMGAVLRGRPQARYAAESGLVIARERLQRTPTYCGSTEPLDTNADGVDDTNVEITVTTCGPGNERAPHIVRARVTY